MFFLFLWLCSTLSVSHASPNHPIHLIFCYYHFFHWLLGIGTENKDHFVISATFSQNIQTKVSSNFFFFNSDYFQRELVISIRWSVPDTGEALFLIYENCAFKLNI